MYMYVSYRMSNRTFNLCGLMEDHLQRYVLHCTQCSRFITHINKYMYMNW